MNRKERAIRVALIVWLVLWLLAVAWRAAQWLRLVY